MKGSESYTYKDYRGGIPPRAFGSETEYTHSGYIENMYAGYGYYGSSIVPLTEHINPDYLVSSGRDQYISAVVSTGGELYVDAEALEYATPECRTPRELALHERAGERITRDTVLRIAAYDDIDKMQLYKRSGYANVPNPTRPETYFLKEDSIGNHENYTSINMFSGRAISKYNDTHAAKSLASYLALRKLIDGIGMVDENHYSITQRPRAIDYCDLTPAGQKHGKKRAFAQHEDRLEIRTGEANKSDWATEFKFGLTSLVIRLVEHEAFPERLQLLDPNQAVSDLARDPLAAVLTKNGIYQKGVDVLREMVDTAVDLCQPSPDWPAYEQQAARDFYKFYDDLHMVSLSDDDVTALADRIDWAGRYKYLVSRGGTYATITTRDLSMVRDDLKWDEINDREISRRYFSRFGHTALQAIIPTAPNTRAKTRIEIAKQLREDDKLSTVEWRAIHGKQGAGVYQFDGPLSQKVTYHPYQRTFNQNNE